MAHPKGSAGGGGRGAGGDVAAEPEQTQPLTQKERWARRAELRRQQADRAQANADRLWASTEFPGSRDPAYLTQPGKIRGRAALNARGDRAYAEQQRADRLRSKAQELERMATTVKGTAAAKQQARRDAWDAKGYKVGDMVDSILYGKRRIVRINKKTVTLDNGMRGFTEDKARLR